MSLALLLAANPTIHEWRVEPTPEVAALAAGAYVVLSAMMLVGLVGLPLKGFGLVVSSWRRLLQGIARLFSRPAPEADPRPLNLDGLSPDLSRFAQQTRTLALELRRRSEEARHWPEDAGSLEQVRGMGWWSELLGNGVDFSPLVDTRREVFDWVDSAARLGEQDRQTLAGLGIEVERVRELLIDGGPVAEGIRSLAGLMWAFDERLSDDATAGYRGGFGATQARGSSHGLPGLGLGLVAGEGEQDDERARARRYADVMDEHGRGISRIASSYAKSSAEREDLEQDIALALWKALPSFRGDSRLDTFVYRVARYCCYRQLRRRGRMIADSEMVAHLDDPDACVEQHMLRADERAQLQRALAGLPDKLEAALELHLRGLSYAEIGERLGISERNVSVRLTRARRRIQLQLAVA